jgi:hypothetical protein
MAVLQLKVDPASPMLFVGVNGLWSDSVLLVMSVMVDSGKAFPVLTVVLEADQDTDVSDGIRLKVKKDLQGKPIAFEPSILRFAATAESGDLSPVTITVMRSEDTDSQGDRPPAVTLYLKRKATDPLYRTTDLNLIVG